METTTPADIDDQFEQALRGSKGMPHAPTLRVAYDSAEAAGENGEPLGEERRLKWACIHLHRREKELLSRLQKLALGRTQHFHMGTMEEVGPPWLSAFDPHGLLIAATRYYLGRMTIQTTTFARALASQWSEIPETTRAVLREAIEQKFEDDRRAREEGRDILPLGQETDRQAWETVRAQWEAEESAIS